MKRLLLVVLALALVCGITGATQVDFQNADDVTTNTVCTLMGTGGYCSWIPTEPNGGNSSYYVHSGVVGNDVYILLPSASQTTYAAATLVGSCSAFGASRIGLFASDKTLTGMGVFSTSTAGRYEIYTYGTRADLYRNGIYVSNITIVNNPYYVGFGAYSSAGAASGCGLWDDIVYGAEENKYIIDAPAVDQFILKKDMVNPATTGFYFSNGTLISNNNMTNMWGRGNVTHAGNETMVLQNVDTGTNYGTRYTHTASYGTASWALADEIFSNGAPYGRYYVTIPGTGEYSDEIWYLGSGATISFDKDTYSSEDTATLTYNILGAYWDTSTYDYSIDVISGTTGATLNTDTIAASAGTSTYTFTATDPLGVYYGIVKATKRSDGSVIWMNYDYAELTSYVTIEGYVNDAETGLPISGANVNITQSSIINNLTTISDGNYSATYYLSGMLMAINATAPTYRQYEFAFTPLSAKTININISLVPDTPSTTGLGIGGVARDLAYGRPIKDATVNLINTTNAESYSKTTSFTGWYLCDEGTSCFLTTARPYDVWGEKLGYSNSANYTAVAP
jgi:hypothetical protein